jgi:hypothetical protein
MSLSDCSKCWETPCICGHGYIGRSIKYKLNLILSILTCEPEDTEELLNKIKLLNL